MAKTNTPTTGVTKGPSKLNKILPIAIVVVVVIAVGFGGYVMGGGGKKKAAPVSTMNDEIAADSGGEKAASAPKEGEAPKAEEAKGEAKGEGKGEAAVPAKSAKESLLYRFDEFGGNLYDPTTHWFVKLTVLAEATSQVSLKKIQENVAPLREAVYFLLSTKTREEMSAPESKERLKIELRKLFEGKLGQGIINDVYTDNVVVFRQ